MLVARGDLLLVWRQADRVSVAPLAPLSSDSPPLRTFTRTSLRDIEAKQRGHAFWLVLCDLECSYCMQSLRHLAEAQRHDPSLRAVTIATDSIEAADEISFRLAQLGIRSEAYAFGPMPAEALRDAIDPQWMGEKPRAYSYAVDGAREAITGIISRDRFIGGAAPAAK